jgi:hypothetical protein
LQTISVPCSVLGGVHLGLWHLCDATDFDAHCRDTTGHAHGIHFRANCERGADSQIDPDSRPHTNGNPHRPTHRQFGRD